MLATVHFIGATDRLEEDALAADSSAHAGDGPQWHRRSLTLGVVSACYAATTLGFAFYPALLEMLLRKEGPLEQLTHLVLLLGVMLTGYLTMRFARSRRYLLYGLFQVVFLLEETDWGQLFVPYPTPGWVRWINGDDMVMNFHNNGIGEPLFIAIVVSVFLLRPAWRLWKRTHRPRSVRELPLVDETQSATTFGIGVGTVAATVLGQLTTTGLPVGPIVQELSDLLFASVVTWVSLSHVRAWRRQEQAGCEPGTEGAESGESCPSAWRESRRPPS